MPKSLNISLPAELRDLVVREVARGRYGSVSDFIRHAVRDALRRSERERLEALALEGLESPVRTMDAAAWKALRAHARAADRRARRR